MPIIEDLIDITCVAAGVLVAIVVAAMCILLRVIALVLPWLVMIAVIVYIAVRTGMIQWM